MAQVPLDYQPRSEAAAAGRRRFIRAAAWCTFGVLMAPVAVVVAFLMSYGREWPLAGGLLFPISMLLPPNTEPGSVGLIAQFPLYGLIVGAAGLTGERGVRLAWLFIGLTHLLAAVAVLVSFYVAGG